MSIPSVLCSMCQCSMRQMFVSSLSFNPLCHELLCSLSYLFSNTPFLQQQQALLPLGKCSKEHEAPGVWGVGGREECCRDYFTVYPLPSPYPGDTLLYKIYYVRISTTYKSACIICIIFRTPAVLCIIRICIYYVLYLYYVLSHPARF